VTRTLITPICVLTFVALQAGAIHIGSHCVVGMCVGHVTPRVSDWLVGDQSAADCVSSHWQPAAALAGELKHKCVSLPMCAAACCEPHAGKFVANLLLCNRCCTLPGLHAVVVGMADGAFRPRAAQDMSMLSTHVVACDGRLVTSF